jgi:hypothetical protein
MIERFPKLVALADRLKPYPVLGSGTTDVADEEEAERLAREDFNQAQGKIVRVSWLCGYNEHDDSEDIYPEGGVLVRVQHRSSQPEQDIVRWMDDEHLDPCWEVEPIEEHPALVGRRSFWVYAPSYRVPHTKKGATT